MSKQVRLDPAVTVHRVTPERVIRQLRKHNFAVLSTVNEAGMPQSAGVNYGVSRPGQDLALYVMTRTHLQKARNIAQNPQVALVVPLARRLLWFLPPPTMQLHGHAELLKWTDDEGIAVFKRFWMGRRILKAYAASHNRGETRICFVKITPDPLIATYMVGYNLFELRKHMESGAAKVLILPEQRASSASVEASALPSSRSTSPRTPADSLAARLVGVDGRGRVHMQCPTSSGVGNGWHAVHHDAETTVPELQAHAVGRL